MEASARQSVTVVVPVYNGESTLPQLLTALRGLNLAGLGEVEFIFVNNNSTDAGPAIIAGFGLTNARLLDESVQGVSSARNRAVANARGEILAFVDADCVPTRQWLRELIAPFADPAVMIVAGGLSSYPPKTAAQRFAAQYGLNDAGRNLKMGRGFANGRNMAVRRSVALALKGWLVDMPRGEDMDFSYRVMTTYKCAIQFQPLAVAFHQDRPDDESLFRQAHGYGAGLAMMYARHPDALPWGRAQRLRRARSTLRRRLGALRHEFIKRIGRGSSQDAEFAIYLNKWNVAYWRGFDDERRASRGPR